MKIIALNEKYLKTFFCCLEDWSDEMKDAGDHKQKWYEKMKEKGAGNMQKHGMRKEIIRCWFIFLVLSMLLLSYKSIEGSNLPQPLAYLSHVYVTLDSTTYSSICNSDFLKDNFANSITKTVIVDSTSSWTGTYVWGENTYIEFFDIGEYENKGYSGIAFGVESENGIESLYQHFTDLGITNAGTFLRYRQVEDTEIPWFNMLGFSNEDTTVAFIVNTWAMEYKSEYMKHKYPDIYPDSLDITRRCYNQKEYRSELLLKDIIEIELALDEPDHNKLFEELTNYGYQIEKKEQLTVASGPDIKIILRAKFENKSGICRIKFSLTDKEYEQQTVQFSDKSKLILNADRTAEWHFDI